MIEIAQCKSLRAVLECLLIGAATNRTFLKRKGGLFKKAHELSVLCSVDVAVIIFGNNKKLYEYSSSDIGEILTRYNYVWLHPISAQRTETDSTTVWRCKRTQRSR
jgi:hypothetical protein